MGYVCQHWGARYGLAIGAVATIGRRPLRPGHRAHRHALEISEAVAVESLAEASTSTGEGPVVALP